MTKNTLGTECRYPASNLVQNAHILNQIWFLQDVNILNSYSVFYADSLHFTDATKYVDPTSYADAMSRPDAKLWREAFDKEMRGLLQRKACTVVERPADRNLLAPQWSINKREIASRTLSSMSSERLAEKKDFFKYKTYRAVLTCRQNRTLYSLAAANKEHMFSSDITQAFTYGKLDVPLNVLRELC